MKLAFMKAQLAIMPILLATTLAITGSEIPSVHAPKVEDFATSAMPEPSAALTDKSTAAEADVAETEPARPHWCNTTSNLVAGINRLGGYSVMRAELSGGRTLERYWNTSEEVVIEHGGDGTSCLVEIRDRDKPH